MRMLMLAAAAVLLARPGAAQDEPKQTEPGKGLQAGLCAEYYYIGKEIKNLTGAIPVGQKPDLCCVDLQVNFEAKDGWGFQGLKWKEHFVAIWSGVVRVPKEGKVTFYLKSDDGSKLYLDGRLLIDNDGTHRLDEDSKTVDLTAGDHEFRVEYFQNKDKAGCTVSWKHEGSDKQVIPASAFWHSFKKELDSETR